MKKLFLIFLSFVLIFSIFGCKENTSKEPTTGVQEFHTQRQIDYFNDENYFKNASIMYAKGLEELSRPLPIVINMMGEKDQKIVKVSTNVDMSGSKEYAVDGDGLELFNLYSHTLYFYTINDGDVYSFSTAKGIRNLYIDGLTNARDVGGYEIPGGYSNQGLLYRTSKLTQDYTGEQLITESGIETLKELGIKTELDLRVNSENSKGIETASITKCVIEGVNYINIPMSSDGNILTSTFNKKALPKIFEVLGNEENYPILFHCSIGTDRTGLISFLVNALSGVGEKDLYRDYSFSNFGNIGGSRDGSAIDDYINTAYLFNGDTLSDKVKAYLLYIKVSETDIDNLIRIMTK